MSQVGYKGWKDTEGEWRFMTLALSDKTRETGRSIHGLNLADGSEPDDGKGLTESKFRLVLADEYGQSPAQIEEIVERAKSGKTLGNT